MNEFTKLEEKLVSDKRAEDSDATALFARELGGDAIKSTVDGTPEQGKWNSFEGVTPRADVQMLPPPQRQFSEKATPDQPASNIVHFPNKN